MYSKSIAITAFQAFVLVVGMKCATVSAQISLSVELDKPPIHYVDTPDDNRVTRLIARLATKEVKLQYTPEYGYLRSLLRELEIPESSQTLVFSKTSMQTQHISRRNPRAVFFNDDTYVAWIRGSDLMEVSTADAKLGAAFYTVDMTPWRANVKRLNYDCLGCHATSLTRGVPGHTLRSVFPDADGGVQAQLESFVSEDSSPLKQRWGGWYVSGQHGHMQHMGNAFFRDGQPHTKDNGNRDDLRNEFDTFGYLSPHSDIVALMVLGHQTQMHNVMTQADFAVRKLIYDRDMANLPVDEREWQLQVQLIAREVVDRLLFCGETALTSEIHGSDAFAQAFTSRGLKDQAGRSLRELNLQTRLFQYPCSYLIYSDAFDSLQDVLRQEIYRQLLSVLKGSNNAERYAHLQPPTRDAILAILRETKQGLPEDWLLQAVP